jgi:hypothetical protein
LLRLLRLQNCMNQSLIINLSVFVSLHFSVCVYVCVFYWFCFSGEPTLIGSGTKWWQYGVICCSGEGKKT